MHVVFVSSFHYPDGGAGASRTLAIARGMSNEGHRVTFLLLAQSDLEAVVGRTDINWMTLVGDLQNPKPRAWRLRSHRALGPTLAQLHVTYAIDALVIVNRDPWIMRDCLNAASLLSLPTYHEITEFPELVARRGLRGEIETRYFERQLLPALTGSMVISTALENYALEHEVKRIALTGPVVDTESYRILPTLSVSDTLCIGYAGSLSQRKDGVLHLLDATRKATDLLNGEITLLVDIVGGQPGSDDLRRARERAQLLGLGSAIRFHGHVTTDAVQEILSSCHVLALPRPQSRQALGGFPTKLGEYLATARPVITTSVGDIPRYLSDRVDCYMTPPDDPDAMAGVLCEIALDYQTALQIGRSGRVLAESAFGLRRISRIVEDLIGPKNGGVS